MSTENQLENFRFPPEIKIICEIDYEFEDLTIANNKPSLLYVTKWMLNSDFMSFGFWFRSDNFQC